MNKTFLTDKQTDYILKKSTGYWDSTVGRKHWSFSNAFDVYDLSRLSRLLKVATRGLIVLDVGLSTKDVYDTWKEDKDWEYEMMQDAVDTIVALGIGALTVSVVLLFVSGGWITCLIAGAAAAAISWGANRSISKYGHEYLEPIIQKMRKKS